MIELQVQFFPALQKQRLHEAARLDPAGFGKPDAALRFVELRVARRIAERLRARASARPAPRASRASCSTPQRRHSSSAEISPVIQQKKKRGARAAREQAVVGRDDGVEDGGGVAGGFGGRLAVPLDQRDLPAARRQALANGRAGDARADDDGGTGLLFSGGLFAGVSRAVHAAFPSFVRTLCVSRRRNPLPRSASRTGAATLQVASGGAGRGEAAEVAQQRRRPHRRVLRRREAVEEDRVRRELQLRQALRDVAEEKASGRRCRPRTRAGACPAPASASARAVAGFHFRIPRSSPTKEKDPAR